MSTDQTATVPEPCTACITAIDASGKPCADCAAEDEIRSRVEGRNCLVQHFGDIALHTWFKADRDRYYGQAMHKFRPPVSVTDQRVFSTASIAITASSGELEHFRAKFRHDMRVMAECFDTAIAAMNHKIEA